MTGNVHLAIALVAAHLVSDFVLQPNWMIARKRSFYILCLHGLVAAVVSYIFAGAWIAWQIPALVFFAHVLIDGVKVWSGRDSLLAFSVDQVSHLVAIGLVSCYVQLAPVAFTWVNEFGGIASALLVLAGAVVAVTRASGVLIGKAIQPFRPDKAGQDGFPRGGEVIGHLERFLILVLVLIREPAAIGFLIAAKSVLRFGDVREHRREAEYVIIGTMWSVSCGLIIALAATSVLQALK
jgi:hypothetical protein